MFELDSVLANDSVELLDLPLCKLLLANDKQYPWFILVPRVSEISEIFQLDWQQQQQLQNESSLLAEFMLQEFAGDKMNIATLGNVVNQLHVHHVVRYKTDPCWPKPIWGQLPSIPYSENELAELKVRIVDKLTAVIA